VREGVESSVSGHKQRRDTQSGNNQANDNQLGNSSQAAVPSGGSSEQAGNETTSFRPNLDRSYSDLDIAPDVYDILDSEFCSDMMIRPGLLRIPGAIQEISQRIAVDNAKSKNPFPVLTMYFIAKARDFRSIEADMLGHCQMIQAGEPPPFLHDDHLKLLYIVQMKFRALKATYRRYREVDSVDDDMNIEMIRHHMKECMNLYHNVLPQLDMLAAHHNIDFNVGETNQSDDLASLRLAGAQERRSARLNNDLRDQL
jgi:hypothetical protein